MSSVTRRARIPPSMVALAAVHLWIGAGCATHSGGASTVPAPTPPVWVTGQELAAAAQNNDETVLQATSIRLDTLRAGDLAYLKQCPNLEALDVADPLGDRDVRDLREIPRLTQLSLSGIELSDRGLREIGQLAGLQHLEITLCGQQNLLNKPGISDKGLCHLARLPALRFLKIRLLGGEWGAKRLQWISDLSRLQHLQSLSLELPENMLRTQAESLGRLNQLKALEVISSRRVLRRVGDRERPLYVGGRITEGVLSQIARLRGLETLILVARGGGITDEHLATLGTLTQLGKLGITSPDLRGHGLLSLQRMNHLKQLSLWDSGITDAGLADVARLPSLAVLDLGRCDIGAQGLANLKHLKRLYALMLVNCKHVTDEGVKRLLELEHIQYLDLYGTEVTEEGKQYLEEHMSGVQIALRGPFTLLAWFP
ncbi:MAG: hypothetical protein R6X20_03320 [Phycisphaerae bacterium]